MAHDGEVAARYLKRAEELLSIADQTQSPDIRIQMLKMAADYEEMAEHSIEAERGAEKPKQPR